MTPVKLYHLAPSHFCEKARAILAYKNIPFEVVNVPYNDHTGLLKLSGQDYTPYIEIPGEKKGVLWHAIADWAEATKPEPTLYPGDAQVSRARSRIVESWAHNVVEEALWKYVCADVPAKIANDAERWVFVELQERKRGSLDDMAAKKPQFLAGVEEVLGMAEDLLGGKPYLFGDVPALADFALWGAMHPLTFSGNPIPKQFEALTAWHGRVSALVND